MNSNICSIMCVVLLSVGNYRRLTSEPDLLLGYDIGKPHRLFHDPSEVSPAISTLPFHKFFHYPNSYLQSATRTQLAHLPVLAFTPKSSWLWLGSALFLIEILYSID